MIFGIHRRWEGNMTTAAEIGVICLQRECSSANTLILDFWFIELRENKFPLFWATQFMVIFYNSHRKLIQWLSSSSSTSWENCPFLPNCIAWNHLYNVGENDESGHPCFRSFLCASSQNVSPPAAYCWHWLFVAGQRGGRGGGFHVFYPQWSFSAVRDLLRSEPAPFSVSSIDMGKGVFLFPFPRCTRSCPVPWMLPFLS